MADIGSAAIIFAFVIALYATAASLLTGKWRRPELWASARFAVFVVVGLTSLASAALVYSFFDRDFTIAYVAEYSSRDLPASYTFAAWWAGQAGSLLFWAWILSLLAVVVVFLQGRRQYHEVIPYVSAVMMGILSYILGIIAFSSNPFDRLPFEPADGMGLNPLLRTSDMFSHPVTLLLGYVGFTVPFAFAVAALISGKLDDWWIRATRRWTLTAWVFLTLGNIFGMVWAYTVLGWGGMWGWDPVENASFMPWLMGTAYLHSVMVQQRRGMLKVWNLLLIILTYSLALFGTLLTRSGILSSVHSFAMGATGPLFVALILIVLMGSLQLLWSRRHLLRSQHELDSLVSREATFLGNNLVLIGAAFAIFWGTVFPLLSEAVRGVKIGVGPPFYEQITAPIFLALIILMGVCPLIGWRKASTENLIRNFLLPTGLGVATSIGLYAAGPRSLWADVAFGAAAFVAAAILLEFWRGVRMRLRHGDNPVVALPRLVWRNKPRYGGYIVHIGVIIMVIGIAGSMFFSTNVQKQVSPGESIEIRGYTLTFEGLTEASTEHTQKVTGTLLVSKDGKQLGKIESGKRTEGHADEPQPVTDVGIRSRPLEDLYVILASWTEDGNSATFKVLVNPLMMWVWVGATVLVVGTGIAFWPDRRDKQLVPTRERAPVEALEATRA